MEFGGVLEKVYYLHILTVDSDGNKVETVSLPIRVQANYHVHNDECFELQSVQKTCTISSKVKTMTYESNYYDLLAEKLGDCPSCGGWGGIVLDKYTYTHSSCGQGSSVYKSQSCRSHREYHKYSGTKLGSSHTYTVNENINVCGKEDKTLEYYLIETIKE